MVTSIGSARIQLCIATRIGTFLSLEKGWQYAARSRSLTSFRSEEHTSELQSLRHLVCRLLLEKKKLISLLLSWTAALLRPAAFILRKQPLGRLPPPRQRLHQRRTAAHQAADAGNAVRTRPLRS